MHQKKHQMKIIMLVRLFAGSKLMVFVYKKNHLLFDKCHMFLKYQKNCYIITNRTKSPKRHYNEKMNMISYMKLNWKSCCNFWKSFFHETKKMRGRTKRWYDWKRWRWSINAIFTDCEYNTNAFLRIDIWQRWMKLVPKMLNRPSDNWYQIRYYSIM